MRLSTRFADFGVLMLLVGLFVVLPMGLRTWQENQAGATLTRVVRTGDIVMFGTADCPVCIKTRRWLNERHIAYTECPIDANVQCAHEFQALGGIGTPTMKVRGQVQAGFSPVWIAQVLTLSSPQP